MKRVIVPLAHVIDAGEGVMGIGGRLLPSGLSAWALLFLLNASFPANTSAETLRWKKTFGGAASDLDEGSAVAVSATGNVYVTGSTYDAEQSDNLLLRKYSPAGVLRWMRQYNGPSWYGDWGYGVAVAADGSVVVSGSTEGYGGDLLLRKYSAAGNLLWTRTYNGSADGYDTGNGVAVAADGSVYVTGSTEVKGQYDDLLLQKYSAAGTLLWTRTYNGSADFPDIGYGVALAPDGAVYVTGNTEVTGQWRNVLLRKYSPNGVPLWTRFYDADNFWDCGKGVAVASDGSVYVTGEVNFSESCDLLLRKYSAAGAPLWTRTYNGAANGCDTGNGVAVAPDSSVFVAGRVEVPPVLDQPSFDLLLLKFSPDGTLILTQTYNGSSRGSDAGHGVAVAADGSVYVIGSTYVEGQSDNLLLLKYK